MTLPAHPFRRAGRRLAPYLAPAVLFGVAVVQIFGASVTELSPWKGGGFGMFSTIDSPGARVLRAYLIHAEERTPVMIPAGLRDLERATRTLPSRARVETLARRLAEGAWVPYRLIPAGEHYRELRRRYLRERGEHAAAGRPELRPDSYSLGNAAYVDLVFENLGFLRMAEVDEEVSDAVPFERVEVELWRLRLDRDHELLVAERLLSGTAAHGD